jgi:hypothetical protein
MVWGVIEPGSFGDFFTHGEFPGWEEDLRKYYDEKMPAKQKQEYLDAGDAKLFGSGAYRSVVYNKFIYEVGMKIVGFPPTTAIEEHELPKTLKTFKPYTNLGSLISTCGFWAADDAFKNIVERLEPNLHQFYPIQIIMPKGKIYPKPYYMLVMGQYFDSFSAEKSDEGSFEEPHNGYSSVQHRTKKYVIGLAFLKDVFGTAHMWRERHFRTPEILISDAMHAEIIKAGLRIPKHFKMKEV